MGLSMSQWDDLNEHDRAWVLGLDEADAEHAAGRCTQCGGPASVCHDYDNQHAYDVTWRRCWRTYAVRAAEKKRGSKDMDGVVAVVVLNPAKKKSAQKQTPTPSPPAQATRPRDERGRFVSTKKG